MRLAAFSLFVLMFFLTGALANTPPVFLHCPASLTAGHCQQFLYDFSADDEDNDSLTYTLVSGPGSIDPMTAIWTWAPSLTDVGYPHTIVIRTCDPFSCGFDCTVQLTVTNEAPVIDSCIDGLLGEGFPSTWKAVYATDACNDPLTYSIVSVVPSYGLTLAMDPQTGVITASTNQLNSYYVTVMVTDGNLSSTAQCNIDVVGGCSYKLRIAGVEDVLPGHLCTVPIQFYTYGFNSLGGFDLSISYPNNALLLQSANLGAAFGPDGCGWEYLTYHQADLSECTGDCPSGLVQLVGIAQSSLVPGSPSCTRPASSSLPTSIIDLQFLVTNDQRLSCEHLPIRYYWRGCTDNLLTNAVGDYQYLECTVADIDRPLWNYADHNVGFPTFKGSQTGCDEWAGEGHPYPYRSVDFVNGAINVTCLDSLSERGDINLNGKPYETADLVAYIEFFSHIWIPEVYPTPRQVAASDINGDGITLSVADLVQMIRIIMGYAYPIPKPNPEPATWSLQNETLSVDRDMGAVFVILKGQVDFEAGDLLTPNMNLGSHFDGVNTRVLIYPPFEIVSTITAFSGPFLNTHGAEIISVEMATSDGSPVTLSSKDVPATFALSQNYPNPFNPTTKISFNLPVASNWTLKV